MMDRNTQKMDCIDYPHMLVSEWGANCFVLVPVSMRWKHQDTIYCLLLVLICNPAYEGNVWNRDLTLADSIPLG